MLKKLITSLGLWYLYFPHMALLRLMGPRCAIPFTRVTSFAHWLLTFVGAQKRVRKTMEQVLPEIRPDLRIRSVLRKYLVIREQHFVQWYISPSIRGGRFAQRACREIEGREHLEAVLRNGRGVIVVFFHFGMARMNLAALMSSGYDVCLHEIPFARYSGRTYDFVARAIMNREAGVKESSGRKAILHQSGSTSKALADVLRRNEIVVLLGDGMAATRFVEVPFLNGMMSFSTGLARLSAETGAPIVCMFSLLEGLTRHRFVIHPPVYCRDNLPPSIEAAVMDYVAVFEDYVRRYPWAWWSWRRLDVKRGTDEKIRLILRDVPTQGTSTSPQKSA